MVSAGHSAYSTNLNGAYSGQTRGQDNSSPDVEKCPTASPVNENKYSEKGGEQRDTVDWADDPENEQNWSFPVSLPHDNSW